MIGVIQRRSQQIVHGRIDDQELLLAVGLLVQQASEQGSGWSNNGAAGFEQEMHLQIPQRFQQGGCVRSNMFRETRGRL